MSKNMKYMFSTDAVIQHKMTDPRWTMNDKVYQWKEIMKLYERDTKIVSLDVKEQKRKQFKKVIALREDIKLKRTVLSKSLTIDTQGIRNVLAEHDRKLVLAYQNLPPQEIIENLIQINYGKQKEYDKLQFKKKEKAQQLINLKLEIAEYENKAKCGICSSYDERHKALESLMQDIVLKKEVALTVQRNFKNILNVMKKDAIFFDSVLISLKEDSVKQANSLYRITKLGQLATEYLDDRVQDYNLLEKIIKKNMKERQEVIDSIKYQINETKFQLKFLIEKTSETDLTKKILCTTSQMDLQRNIDSLNSVLEFIKNFTNTSQFNEMLPRFKDQSGQYKRLKVLVNTRSGEKDKMLKKRSHAELMYNSVNTTMASTTMHYIEMKKEHKELVDGLNKNVEKTNKKIVELAEILLSVRVALQRLDELTSCVITKSKILRRSQIISLLPEKPETDVSKLISILNERYKILMGLYEELRPERKDEAVKLYQYILTEAYQKANADKFAKRTDTSLVLEREVEDPNIPSRDFIKKRSEFIVSSCAIKADEEPITLLPLRGKTF